MDSLGGTIRKLREERELPLRTVAAYLDKALQMAEEKVAYITTPELSARGLKLLWTSMMQCWQVLKSKMN